MRQEVADARKESREAFSAMMALRAELLGQANVRYRSDAARQTYNALRAEWDVAVHRTLIAQAQFTSLMYAAMRGI